MYRQTHRVFSPRIRQDTWRSVPLQQGGGFGSFLSRIGRKFVPLLKKQYWNREKKKKQSMQSLV